MPSKWSLILLPDDTGVKNVGGRPGTSKGPEAFSLFFNKYSLNGTFLPEKATEKSIDIHTVADIHSNHESAVNLISEAHKNAGISIIIGGGHDYAYPHLKGIQEAFPGQTIGCINIDPHFDLRPHKPVFTSGSGFRAAIEENIISAGNFIEFGIQDYCNASALFEYAQAKGVVTVNYKLFRVKSCVGAFSEYMQILNGQCDIIAISLDLDAISSAFAPGVSAPAPEGFTPTEIIQMMHLSAQSPKVISLGIYELNPLHDVDNRTARLAAQIVFEFLNNRHLQKNMKPFAS